ncbi:MAG: hypothetical protein ACYTGC_11005, partial [Planctomycetota bacterium]
MALVALPLVLRPAGEAAPRNARRLIIITPHNEQIRREFAVAFDRWHRDRYGEPVEVIYNVPGGTSEIRKMLNAQFESALKKDEPPGGSADLMFGGGTYEHQTLKRGVEVTVGDEKRTASISAPAAIGEADLTAIYGENLIGDVPLYDVDRHWFGTAVSGFGIVFNRDVLRRLGLGDPGSWVDLCDP